MRFGILCGLAALLTAQQIERLDGSKLGIADAESFARETLSANKVTGAQIALLNQGRLVWSFAYGLRQINPDLPMTPTTNTWAASITKGVFGVYVQHLVETEKFNLDLPIAQQMPQRLDAYPAYKELASDLVKDPRWPRITPRMALNHTTGFGNLAVYAPDKKIHIYFEPGDRFSYSGDAMNLLQFLIEQKKGRPLNELMDEVLFQPLNMTRTGMIFRKEFEENVADRFNAKGEFVAKTRRFPARAAGNMSTCAEDLARLASSLLEGKLVNLKQLLKPTVRIRTATQFPLSLDTPPPAVAAYPNLAYGMGWGLLTKTKFGPAFFKEGHGDGAQNFMICFTRSKSCMILLTNSDNGERAFRSLLEKILGNTVTPWAWHGYSFDPAKP